MITTPVIFWLVGYTGATGSLILLFCISGLRLRGGQEGLGKFQLSSVSLLGRPVLFRRGQWWIKEARPSPPSVSLGFYELSGWSDAQQILSRSFLTLGISPKIRSSPDTCVSQFQLFQPCLTSLLQPYLHVHFQRSSRQLLSLWGSYVCRPGCFGAFSNSSLRFNFLILDPLPHICLLTGFQNCVAIVFYSLCPCGIMSFIFKIFSLSF